jgi:exopolysaccharide biosynthesis polyprenyl glycosylphosphotransferase
LAEGTKEFRLPSLPIQVARPTPNQQKARSGTWLRAALVWIDALGFVLSFGMVLWLTMPAAIAPPIDPRLSWATWIVAVTTGLVLQRVQRLYLARVCAVREVELARTGRSAVVAAPVARLALGAVVTFTVVGLARGVYAALLRERRARGLWSRPLVLVGTNDEARQLADLLETHPEFGYRISGVVGDRHDRQRLLPEVPYLGPIDRTAEVLRASGDDGVLISASVVDTAERKTLIRELLAQGVHVHLSSGLQGVDARRIRPLPIAQEPLYYIETPAPRRLSLAVKRMIDITVGSVLFLLTLPIIMVAAIAIKLTDRGPVFFRQVRIGQHGKPIVVTKLRTMVPDAGELLPDLADANERDGVLFKLTNDPRRTRVGRLLEAASLDELPQLMSVITGTMSLVGPRPALPSEVARFDEDHMARHDLPPGVTGLWQVQSRDNPSFAAYRRLDLFYIDNWSLIMDLAILFETVTSVAGRILNKIARRRSVPSPSFE